MNYDILQQASSPQANKIMRVKMLMAEGVAEHADHTVTAFRIGIDRVITKSVPVGFKGYLFARIELGQADWGKHEILIRCVDPNGVDVFPAVGDQQDFPNGSKVVNVVTVVVADFKTEGTYRFSVSIDGQEKDDWPFTVQVKPEGTE
jgi:hypothetical protein